MDTVNLIYDYFPELTEEQRERFARLEGLYREWNEKINVISRKDMDEFWVHHVLHSLAIAKIIRFCSRDSGDGCRYRRRIPGDSFGYFVS